jgi:DNA processing protein
MDKTIRTVTTKDVSPMLAEIYGAPKTLRLQGRFPVPAIGQKLKYLTVVGSRKYSEYGKQACEHLIAGLAGYPIVIISGLALGMDSIAHTAALSAGLTTVAVPGSGLGDTVLYPVSGRPLRDQILASGGCLLSEYEDDTKAADYTFPQRNRIMAGLSHASLIIEAELKSGTLITSKYATEFNRDVFTVPHSIFDKTSEGPHMLLRLGATPITKPEDILEAFGFTDPNQSLFARDYSDCSEDEKAIIRLLSEPMPRDEILMEIGKPVHMTQTVLSIMEIKGLIKEELGAIRLV